MFMLRNRVHLIRFEKGQSNLFWCDNSTVYLGDSFQKPKGITYTEGRVIPERFYLAFFTANSLQKFQRIMPGRLKGWFSISVQLCKV